MGGPVLDASGQPDVTPASRSSQRIRVLGIAGILVVAIALVGVIVALSGGHGHPSAPGAVESFYDTGSQRVAGLAFSPSGKSLAVADANGNADLWNVSTHNITVLNDPEDQEAGAVAFSPNGSTLLSALLTIRFSPASPTCGVSRPTS